MSLMQPLTERPMSSTAVWDDEHVKALLHLFTIARNLERAGDLTKNIAEEIVFHLEAKVLKHQKDK